MNPAEKFAVGRSICSSKVHSIRKIGRITAFLPHHRRHGSRSFHVFAGSTSFATACLSSLPLSCSSTSVVSNLPLHPHFEAIIVSPENPPPSTPMQWLDNRWLENRCLDNRCLEDRCLDDQCCSSNSKADAVR
ncbi:hypothetical protein CGCF415_v015506 [Colletotrichum fructicola]|nr:hypothetical protein CGCFRS4_v015491 [Colletotrichum fructicola]KAF4884949.1 hypothetical protein CGCF415_v015506 [Colletotrichum fructicola]KAF4922138.1 hypothetical protein CGCF245_v015429 [Colletotrichum fructicola]